MASDDGYGRSHGRLFGKKALVYGGGTGLGFACARAMMSEGATAFVSGRREGKLKEAVNRLSPLGPVSYKTGDATVPDNVAAVTDAAVNFLGGLDTLVISSGTAIVASVFTTKPEQFKHVIDTNMLPAFLATHFAAEHLIAAGRASVIVIASIYGEVGIDNRVAYCASKHGVVGMVRAMALDFATRGVTVNAISPGFVETELALEVISQESDPTEALARRRLMHPIPRAGRPEEIGTAAVYLASDEAAWVTGHNLLIDGGYTAR